MHPIRSAFAAATCLCLLTGIASAQTTPAPAPDLEPGYTKPGLPPALNKALGLQYKLLDSGIAGQKTYVLSFAKGDELLSGLAAFARQEHIAAASLTGIGTFDHALFGWFDRSKKAYRNIPVDQPVEVLGLTGNITMSGATPIVHVHAVVGLPDGTTRGGHVLSATVWPTLEVFVTDSPVKLQKTPDAETGLNLLNLKE